MFDVVIHLFASEWASSLKHSDLFPDPGAVTLVLWHLVVSENLSEESSWFFSRDLGAVRVGQRRRGAFHLEEVLTDVLSLP